MNKRWISHTEMARRLGVSRQTIWKRIMDHTIPGRTRYLGAMRVERKTFEDWLLFTDPAQTVNHG